MIPIAMPFLDVEEADAARQAVLSGWVSQGPQVAAFEKEFSDLVGSPYACAVSNCTTALHLALLAVDVARGDEVITASHSFIATANCIRYCGATPIFVDIDPATYNMDAHLVEKAITLRTRAILVVHQMGMPCDLGALVALAKAHNIPLIEDAACAIGSQVYINGQWQPIGKPHGQIACFSFHPRKVITTGEGGMLTTANPEFDRKFRLWRQHSMSVADTVRHGSQRVIFEEYSDIGFNYRMTDIQAAIGRKQLVRLNSLVARRREIAARYAKRLQGIDGLALPLEREWARSNWQSYCVRIPDGIDQVKIMQNLLNQGISTRRGIMCSHRERPYLNSKKDLDLRQSEFAQDSSVLLPIYAQMTDEDVDTVASALRKEIRESFATAGFRNSITSALSHTP